MESTETTEQTGEPPPLPTQDWLLALRVLSELLSTHDGCVSSAALRKELERNHGIANARPVLVELAFFDIETSRERGIPTPDFKFFHRGRSFYSEEKYRQVVKEAETTTSEEAENASQRESVAIAEEPAAPSRTYRQEEARLVTYVKTALEEIYASEINSDDNPFVFDVHSERRGTSFENVDVIAVHWRPCDVIDLITVEAKLDFNAQVVQQALNYSRFSHRAWIAVPVETDASESASELRERDPNLFEYTISRGLGILACRRRQGRKYEVFPVHWPTWNKLDPLEYEEFLERYRTIFEEAGILESKAKKPLPRLR